MKFSIVTVAYNAASTIADTLTSVVRQKDVEIESIVIDGGSADETMNVVRSFGDKLAKVVSEPDRGIYDAMNKGLTLATGDFVGFLNADDYYADENVLRDVAKTFSAMSTSAVAGAVDQIDNKGRIIRMIRAEAHHARRLRWALVPPHPGLFVKTMMARDAGGFDVGFRIAGDFDLFVRLSRMPGFSLAILDRTLVKMRIGGASTAGMGIYLQNSQELKLALVKNGYSDNNWRVYLRAFRKLPELIPWRRAVRSENG